ncbi:hypothetical protein [Treponema berlinense]|uniref:hypothetical protein n=1 Tax=Treponema berlinense TaxID=225004 RepID=UPI0023F905BE|nr:hypothetical protein [Treponema berlinense]
MEFYVNGTKIDVELENEKTIGDVLRCFEEECAKSNATTVCIIVDGKNISAEDFDKTAEKPLCPDTKIELGIISQEAIENSFNEEKESCRKLSEELKQIPVKFQAGKDNEANSIITSLADLIDNICHTASLSALFPQKFGKIKIEGKTFVEFFADLSPVLKDFEQAIESKDTVLLGDLAEYEISPRLDSLADALEA